MEMVRRMLQEREYVLTDDAQNHIRDHLQRIRSENQGTFSNGRYIRNMIEEAIRIQAVRLLRDETFDKESLVTIKRSDLQFHTSHVKVT